MIETRVCIGVLLAALFAGCGTSLCNERRDPSMVFCTGDRIDLAEAVERARTRQPELADATLVRATSGGPGSLNVDGMDDEWRLIFVVAGGEGRTLTVRPSGVPDVRPGGAPDMSCNGATNEELPPSVDSTQNTVLHYELAHGTFEQGGELDLEIFYEHDCYDQTTPRTFHVHVTQTTELGRSHWFYTVTRTGLVDAVCGPCELADVDSCTPCTSP